MMKTPSKIKLAFTPTPLQVMKYEGNKFLIKRDDLTGMELTGNKVRKLEYLLAEAKKEKADYVFTTGGEQSNHARATVIAAAQLGIQSKIYLWGKDKGKADGNLFLDKVFGAEIEFLSKKEMENAEEIMNEEKERFVKEWKRVYIIPEGGSSALGIWGYIDFMNELREQVDIEKLEGIVAACGSGGTAAGLLLGAAILGLNIKIYAVNVLYPFGLIKEKILNLARECIHKYQIECDVQENNLIIMDGYSREGYKNISWEKVHLIRNFASSCGILFDPAYTGKAFYAYHENFIKKNKGMKNLFIHTGGIYGVFGKRDKYLSLVEGEGLG
jgi:D-cysteine desulfhydrase